VRSEADYFGDIPEIKLPADMMKLAQHIIKTKSADFDASMLEDHYRTSLVRILRKRGEFNGRSTPQHRRREASSGAGGISSGLGAPDSVIQRLHSRQLRI
jgi:non-homologous end joining protein Ku